MNFVRKVATASAVQFNGDNHDEIVKFAGLEVYIVGRTKELHVRLACGGSKRVVRGDWVLTYNGRHYDSMPNAAFLNTFSETS